MNLRYILFIPSFLFTFLGQAQNTNSIADINKVWMTFCEAYRNMDYTVMEEIHSDDLVRVSGGKRIIGKAEYIAGYQTQFERAKEEGISYELQLRFFERLQDDKRASERGVYQLKRSANGETNSYYGQFHVILNKIDGVWKIRMDYDSNEGGTIGEKEFLAAMPMNDWK